VTPIAMPPQNRVDTYSMARQSFDFYYQVNVEGETASNAAYMQTENSMNDLGFPGALRSRGTDWWERPHDFDVLTNFNGRTIIDGHSQ
jgi:hypothetical protein